MSRDDGSLNQKKLLLGLLLAGSAAAQEAPEKPKAAPTEGSSPAQLEKVEVKGPASAATRRRASTASKIVIDREELARYGDTQLGDVLRRLPGVTIGGRPGRGGDIRMRGLGGGFTQILIDGERAPAGFSVEQLPPDQVERIEIFRAPTAETGARAVAGTINIILREALTKSAHEARAGVGVDRQEPQADFSWTRNLKAGGPKGDDWVGALSVSGNLQRRFNDIDVESRSVDLSTGLTRSASTQKGETLSRSANLNANARLRWRLSDTQSLHLSPFAFISGSRGNTQFKTQGFSSFDAARGRNESSNNALRLNATWQWRTPPPAVPTAGPQAAPASVQRWELRTGLGRSRAVNDNERFETLAVQLRRTQQDHTETVDDNATLGAKWSVQTTREHQWVTGLELEAGQREQLRQTLENGSPKPGLEEFGDSLSARTQRIAAYTQDEWSPNKQWSIYAGLRWEQISTRGDAGGVIPTATNTSRVASPLFHLLWKPEAFPKDQVRLSLTRSYRAPGLNDLIARPVVNASYPNGPNPQTSPDRAGNPGLKPELATGIDLSLEHWLATGGVLMVSGYVREVNGLIRNLLAQETVPWDASPRWVSRPRNLDRARSSGIELEAKARLDELWEDAPDDLAGLLLRANLTLFQSKVEGIPGPNNRLEQQPKGTLNLGLDYRWKAGFGSGFNLSIVPGGTIQQTPILQREDNLRRVWDAYLSWTSGDPRDGINWRLSLANLAPLETRVLSTVESGGVRSTTLDRKRTFMVWSLRAETRF